METITTRGYSPASEHYRTLDNQDPSPFLKGMQIQHNDFMTLFGSTMDNIDIVRGRLTRLQEEIRKEREERHREANAKAEAAHEAEVQRALADGARIRAALRECVGQSDARRRAREWRMLLNPCAVSKPRSAKKGKAPVRGKSVDKGKAPVRSNGVDKGKAPIRGNGVDKGKAPVRGNAVDKGKAPVGRDVIVID